MPLFETTRANYQLLCWATLLHNPLLLAMRLHILSVPHENRTLFTGEEMCWLPNLMKAASLYWLRMFRP